MIGIYLITNTLNNKHYVGQSRNISVRWSQHKTNAFNPNCHTYDYPLYRAIRKYGIENFTFSVLEEVSADQLTTREQYWIDNYHTLDPHYGYNLQPATNAHTGDSCNFSILRDRDIPVIVELLMTSYLTIGQIATMFNVSSSCIEDINKGRRRVQEGIQYPIRVSAKSFGHMVSAGTLTPSDILTMRQRYVTETAEQIYSDYQHLISFTAFKKALYGETWKRLPIYRKREKRWVIN